MIPKRKVRVATAAVVFATLLGGAGAIPLVQAADPSSVPGEAVSPAVALSGTIRVQEWGAGGEAMWVALKEAFEARYPGVTVQLEQVPYPNYNEKVGSYVALGDGPDVFVMENGGAINTFKGSLTPLNDLAGDVLGGLTSPEMACEAYDCSNTVWGLPISLQAHPIFYNKQVLTDAGLDPEAPPTTIRELDDACAKIKALGKDCFAMGGKGFGAAVLWLALSLYTATTDELYAVGTGATPMNGPAIGSASTIFAWMIERGWFPDDAVSLTLSPDAQGMFEKGDAAFLVGFLGDDLTWFTFDKTMGPENYGVMQYPKLESGTIPGVEPGENSGKLDVVAANSLVIPKWTKNPDAALAFIRWATSPEAAALMAPFGVYPASKDFDTTAIDSAGFQDMVEIAKSNAPDIYWLMSLRAQTELLPQLELLLLGETTPAAMNDALELANKDR